MIKKKLVVASVLKPVNDSRNYEKTAISILKSNKYHIYLVGQDVSTGDENPLVSFIPLFSFSRTSYKRLKVGFSFFSFLSTKKPDVVIVTTAELLLSAVLYKWIYGGKLIYDVQENYFRNLWYTNSFPKPINYFLAVSTRLIEYVIRPFVDHFVLAEKRYREEFSFANSNCTVIENKLPKSAVIESDRKSFNEFKFLYSGTISESYGVFTAVDLVIRLHAQDPTVRLKIIGFAPKNEVYLKLLKRIEPLTYVELIGGHELVPHPEILKSIATADIGLVPYLPNKSTENCMPTKLYEYAAFKLPYLISKNNYWNEFTDHHKAGIEIDFLTVNIYELLEEIKTTAFYSNFMEDDLYWDDAQWIDVLALLDG